MWHPNAHGYPQPNVNYTFIHRRGPSRLLWFVLGGVAASMWVKSKSIAYEQPDGTWERRWSWRRENGWDCGPRIQKQQQSIAAPAPTQAAPEAPRDPSTAIHTPIATLVHPHAAFDAEKVREQQAQQKWEQNREEFMRQAGDSMTELSEKTLDSVMSTVEALKAKLAEHRVQREEQARIIEEQRKTIEEQQRQQAFDARRLV